MVNKIEFIAKKVYLADYLCSEQLKEKYFSSKDNEQWFPHPPFPDLMTQLS